MSRLIPVIYKNMNYPSHIEANIHEVSGNFHKEKLIIKYPYSLHTEPSFGERRFSSDIISDLVPITSAQRNATPQLWYNEKWARGFFIFIKRLIDDNKPPEVLEIHPPFNDYCSSFEQFLDVFDVFYQKFIDKYPKTTIVIENRFGTRYESGKFLLSTCSDVLSFCRILSQSNIKLELVLDYPQIFSAEINNSIKKDENVINWMGSYPNKLLEKIIAFNLELKKYREVIGGFHMWGKLRSGKRWIPHAGNFDTFFSNDNELKHMFLSSVFSTFNDDVARYFVPEVNSGERDLHSIVTDMEKEGFIFLSKKCYMSKAMKKIFNGFFRWPGIKIPDRNLDYRESGYIEKDGWQIQFCFGKKDGKEYMDLYCSHRMTNDRHERIYEDGTSEDLPAFPEFLTPYNPDDPEDKKRAEEEDKKNINKIKKLLIEKGFYPFPYTNNFVSNINIHLKNNM